MAIFKVFYQENASEIPVRENTKSLYLEAESVVDVRKFLEEKNYNIEFIQELSDAHLEYEKGTVDFEIGRIDG